MLFSCSTFCADGKIIYSRSTVLKTVIDRPKNCVSIFIYFCINLCFALGKLTKSVPCLVRIFEGYNRIFGPMLLLQIGIFFRSPIQILTSPDRGKLQ